MSGEAVGLRDSNASWMGQSALRPLIQSCLALSSSADTDSELLWEVFARVVRRKVSRVDSVVGYLRAQWLSARSRTALKLECIFLKSPCLKAVLEACLFFVRRVSVAQDVRSWRHSWL